MRIWIIRSIVFALLAAGATALIIFVSTQVLEVGPLAHERHQNLQRFVTQKGKTLVSLLASGNIVEANKLVERARNVGGNIQVYDASLSPLTGGTQGQEQPKMRTIATKAVIAQKFTFEREGQTILSPPKTLRTAIPLTGPDGKQYIVALELPRRTIAPNAPYWKLSTAIGSFVLAALILLFLVRSTDGPANEIRNAVRRFSKGDLNARIDRKLEQRGDQVAKLARDFNNMADNMARLHDEQRRLFNEISHEMRSPLSRMSLAVELASRDGDNKSTQMLERIQKDADKLGQLSQQMLELGRMQKGQIKVFPVALEMLVEDVVDECRFEAAGQQKEIGISLDENTELTVNGNPELLMRMVENVVRNAIRHSPEGSSINVGLEQASNFGRDNALITVSDSGCGVAENEIHKIFQPFYRAKNSAEGGTGLGLSITRQVAVTHGGTTWGENLPNGGFKVSMRLPLLGEEESLAEPDESFDAAMPI